MKYRLCCWEINGYSDSDWMVGLFDDETNDFECVCYDTTRFAPSNDGGYNKYPLPTKEIIEQARLILAHKIFNMMKQHEYFQVMEPNHVFIGDRVVLNENHKNQKTEHDLVSCAKCSGSGFWINPRNDKDKRSCLSCNGTGKVKGNFRKVKNDSGKTEWEKFEKGLKGKVIWTGTYRQIYRNGYNKLDRSTMETRILLDDGREMKCPLSKLALDQELTSDHELLEKSREVSFTYDFGPIFHKFTWYDHNWAAEIINKEES